MTQISFYLRRLLGRMWFLPAVFSAVAVLTIVIAYYLARWAPEELFCGSEVDDRGNEITFDQHICRKDVEMKAMVPSSPALRPRPG